ncbi:uncharacterized protein [Pithys albifrons albifrons]|uniref:uncharacterized protein n=1 Tax=Pithys albifrons albifrons TaxID=3385563 RepID=UPI003A5D11C1
MERGLGLEQRAERLVRRSQLLLRPRTRGPEGAESPLGPAPSSPTLGDPLVQWRLRRCRGEEPALDTPSVGGGSSVPRDPPGARQWPLYGERRDPPEPPQRIRSHVCVSPQRGAPLPQPNSQEPLQREPCFGSRDAPGALWGAPCWGSRDSQDAPQTIRRGTPDVQQCQPSQQALGPPQDPILQLLWRHHRALWEQLRAVETLLELPTQERPIK